MLLALVDIGVDHVRGTQEMEDVRMGLRGVLKRWNQVRKFIPKVCKIVTHVGEK